MEWLSDAEIETEALSFSVDYIQVLQSPNSDVIINAYREIGVNLDATNTNEEDIKNSAVVSELIASTRYTKNIIIYGPPGTGKTYAVQQFQDKFLENTPSKLSYPQKIKNNLTLWQALALKLYKTGQGGSLSIDELLNSQPLVYLESEQKDEIKRSAVLHELITHSTREESAPVDTSLSQPPILFGHMQEDKWSLTEEGFTYVRETLRDLANADWSTRATSRMEFVTFHPSFAYEEFVEGLRPETTNGQLTYRVRDGVFKRICRDAEQELLDAKQAEMTPRRFLLVIDEINRANIAKVFGELMTLIEDDKRVTADGGGVRVTLPYSGDSFGVPDNLTIIGTMNTADRSIALLDLALRRRFTFIEVLPDANVIRATTGANGVIDGVNVAEVLDALNAKVRALLDRDHQVGHSYLTGIQGGLPELRFRWQRKVVPLLQEYFHNDGEKLKSVLGEAFIHLEPQRRGMNGRHEYEVVTTLDDTAFLQALQCLIPSPSTSATASEQHT